MGNKRSIADIFKTYPMKMDAIETFLDFHQLYDCNLEKCLQNINIYPTEDLNFIGVYLKYNENNELIGYNSKLPAVNNLYDALIFIHELTHCLVLENHISKNIPIEEEEYCEVLPTLYEDLFINYLIANKHYMIKDLYDEYKKERYTKKENDDKYIFARDVIEEKLSIPFNDNSQKFVRDLKSVISAKISMKDFIEIHHQKINQ